MISDVLAAHILQRLDSFVKIDAMGLHYRELNTILREVVEQGARKIEIRNVYGQRYLGTDLNGDIHIDVYGVPGNDLGSFLNGPTIIVHGPAQDGCGNTMNEGEIVVHGHAGDILAMSARSGKIFVRDDVGYRCCIHMKGLPERRPYIVVGGTSQDFFGEYMAGGVAILLGLTLGEEQRHKARFIGTGMHGGVIYLRGEVEDYQLGKEVGIVSLEEQDWDLVRGLVGEYTSHFGGDPEEILRSRPFLKLYPKYLRPYGRQYAY